jgi:hypothetical protein
MRNGDSCKPHLDVIGMPSPMNNNGFCAAAFRLGAVPDSQWANGRSAAHKARPFGLAGVPPMAPVNLRPAYM